MFRKSGSIDNCYAAKLTDTGKMLTSMLERPHYNGGNDSLNDFLSTNIRFENLISNLPETGRIYKDTARVKFIVSKKGSLRDLSVELAKNEMFADQIARVIKESSCNWVAGRSGDPINGWFGFDIYFAAGRARKQVKTKMTLNEFVPAD